MDIEAPFIILIALVVAAVLIYLWYLACREFAFIASEKGWSERRYFHFCFWMGLVGILMVIALPDREDDNVSAPQPGPAASPAPAAAPRRAPEQPAAVPTSIFHDGGPAPEAPASAAEPAAQRKPGPTTKAPRTVDVPAPDTQVAWSCRCGTQNSASTFLCSGCRTLWHCTCGKLNDRQARKCAACRAWHCACGKLNPASRGSCDSCGEAKPR